MARRSQSAQNRTVQPMSCCPFVQFHESNPPSMWGSWGSHPPVAVRWLLNCPLIRPGGGSQRASVRSSHPPPVQPLHCHVLLPSPEGAPPY